MRDPFVLWSFPWQFKFDVTELQNIIISRFSFEAFIQTHVPDLHRLQLCMYSVVLFECITDVDCERGSFDVVVKERHVQRVERGRAQTVEHLSRDETSVVFTQTRFFAILTFIILRSIDVARCEMLTLNKKRKKKYAVEVMMSLPADPRAHLQTHSRTREFGSRTSAL